MKLEDVAVGGLYTYYLNPDDTHRGILSKVVGTGTIAKYAPRPGSTCINSI
jgi:hypothetical protein